MKAIWVDGKKVGMYSDTFQRALTKYYLEEFEKIVAKIIIYEHMIALLDRKRRKARELQ